MGNHAAAITFQFRQVLKNISNEKNEYSSLDVLVQHLVDDDILWNKLRRKLIDSKVTTNVGVIEVTKIFLMEMKKDFESKSELKKNERKRSLSFGSTLRNKK